MPGNLLVVGVNCPRTHGSDKNKREGRGWLTEVLDLVNQTSITIKDVLEENLILWIFIKHDSIQEGFIWWFYNIQKKRVS